MRRELEGVRGAKKVLKRFESCFASGLICGHRSKEGMREKKRKICARVCNHPVEEWVRTSSSGTNLSPWIES